MDYVERAKQLRPLIEKASKSLSDEDAYSAPELFPAWKNETAYTKDDRVQYEVKLYKCLQSHTSQADWTPDVSVSLWVEVPDPSQEWPEWKQPTGAQDAYEKGAKVSHNDKHWISEYDANVWEPGVFGWTES
jgi:hypothetical protein